jgi:hypothetical protein
MIKPFHSKPKLVREQALQEHIARSPEAQKSFLKRVQVLQLREYGSILRFLSAA